MSAVAEIVFWVCAVLIVHTYALYPLMLMVMRPAEGSGPSGDGTGGDAPAGVSVVLSVYNEEALIGGRIENLLRTSVPPDRLEILVGSDGSDDGTNTVLSRMAGERIRVFLFPDRRGKAAVLNDLVKEARYGFIVFTDANTSYEPDTIPRLLGPFGDPRVGGVCGRLELVSGRGKKGSDGEMSYWSYENRLKGLESNVRTILGATGAVYAIRRELFDPLPADRLAVDDFLVPLGIVKKGYRVKYHHGARAVETTTGAVGGEFRRKVRIGTANFFAIREFRDLLHPRAGFVAFALWSHKIIRWMAPVILMAMFAMVFLLRDASPVYSALWSAGLVFLALAAAGFLGEKAGWRMSVLVWPYYFLAMNLALFVGFIRFLLDRRSAHWNVVR